MIDFYRKTAGLHKLIQLLAVHALLSPMRCPPVREAVSSRQHMHQLFRMGAVVQLQLLMLAVHSFHFQFFTKAVWLHGFALRPLVIINTTVVVRSAAAHCSGAAAQRIPPSLLAGTNSTHTHTILTNSTCFFCRLRTGYPGGMNPTSIPNASIRARSSHIFYITCNSA